MYRSQTRRGRQFLGKYDLGQYYINSRFSDMPSARLDTTLNTFLEVIFFFLLHPLVVVIQNFFVD